MHNRQLLTNFVFMCKLKSYCLSCCDMSHDYDDPWGQADIFLFYFYAQNKTSCKQGHCVKLVRIKMEVLEPAADNGLDVATGTLNEVIKESMNQG